MKKVLLITLLVLISVRVFSVIQSPVQQMIDNALDGTTIYVPSGEYVGTINISNRSNLTIAGVNSSNTILKGVMNAPVFNIVSSNNISIKKFTVSEGRNHRGGDFYIDY